MKDNSLEPGLLSVFRLFAGLRLALLVLTKGGQELSLLQFIPPPSTLSILDATLLLSYLSWPWLQSKLGRFFLPGALAITSISTIAEHYFLFEQRPMRLDLDEPMASGVAWLLFIFVLPTVMDFLFVPLMITAWQYDFRWVLIFSFSTTMLELVFSILLGKGHSRSFFPVVTRTTSFVVIGYMVTRLVKGQREHRRALAQANVRLAQYATTLEQLAISRERNRLARELHDTLAHTLSALAVQLEAVSALWDTNPKAGRTMLEQSLSATRSGLSETRRALKALRAAPIEDMGLILAIRNLAESVAARTGLALDLQLPGWIDDLSPEAEQSIYRIAQEALVNVAQHAGASRVALQLVREGGRLVLTVSDDGRGFDLDDVDSEHRFGLRGMRERAEVAGGSLEVESQPGQGTTVRLVIGGEA